MNLMQINDPKVRNRAKEIVGQVEAASEKQAEALLKGLASGESSDGICFGHVEDNRKECVQCWLEIPCRRFREMWNGVVERVDDEVADS